MVASIIIKKGFNTSIGWNLGRNIKSIHLLDPFISMPTIGTKNKATRETIKKIIEYLKSWLVLMEEKIKIKSIPIQI